VAPVRRAPAGAETPGWVAPASCDPATDIGGARRAARWPPRRGGRRWRLADAAPVGGKKSVRRRWSVPRRQAPAVLDWLWLLLGTLRVLLRDRHALLAENLLLLPCRRAYRSAAAPRHFRPRTESGAATATEAGRRPTGSVRMGPPGRRATIRIAWPSGCGT